MFPNKKTVRQMLLDRRPSKSVIGAFKTSKDPVFFVFLVIRLFYCVRLTEDTAKLIVCPLETGLCQRK